MSKIVPTISSATAGPLGVRHLPRLWCKASLAAVGKLHDDYPAAGGGFDQMVLDAIGIDREVFLNYINESKPSYVACEAWILEQKGGSLDQAKIDEVNSEILGYTHDDDTRKEILDAAGRADDGSIKDGVNLNNLDDWAILHKHEIAS